MYFFFTLIFIYKSDTQNVYIFSQPTKTLKFLNQGSDNEQNLESFICKGLVVLILLFNGWNNRKTHSILISSENVLIDFSQINTFESIALNK